MIATADRFVYMDRKNRREQTFTMNMVTDSFRMFPKDIFQVYIKKPSKNLRTIHGQPELA